MAMVQYGHNPMTKKNSKRLQSDNPNLLLSTEFLFVGSGKVAGLIKE